MSDKEEYTRVLLGAHERTLTHLYREHGALKSKDGEFPIFSQGAMEKRVQGAFVVGMLTSLAIGVMGIGTWQAVRWLFFSTPSSP